MEITRVWRNAENRYVFLSDNVLYHPFGNPYIVNAGDVAMLDMVEAYLAEHPEALVDEPVPPEPTREQKAASVRSQRNALLAECDWTQLGDVPVDERMWADYRQALRDVTDQAGFPDSVEWPKRP